MHPGPLFEIFGLEVYPYGIFIALGLIACVIVLKVYSDKRKMNPEVQDFIFFVAIIAVAGGFLFAKLFQAFYDWIAGRGFDFANAGITVMGGLIGGAGIFLALYFGWGKYYLKGTNKNAHIKEFNTIFCVAPLCICIAHGFGRLGCLMAGCCHGAFLGSEYVFGGIYMSTSKGTGYFVPTQLYEALFLFALFAVLSVMYYKRCNIIMAIYLIAYGVWRFILEFIRTDYVGGVEGAIFRPSHWTSIIFIVLGIAILVFYYYKKIPFFLPKEEKVIESVGDNNSNAEIKNIDDIDKPE